MRKSFFILPFFLVLTLTLVNVVYAVEGDDINLQTFDDALAERFGISVFAGGILATTILALMFLIPIAVYTKTLLPPMIIGILTIGFGIAVGWLDVFFMLIIILLIAFMFAGNMKDLITGRGR